MKRYIAIFIVMSFFSINSLALSISTDETIKAIWPGEEQRVNTPGSHDVDDHIWNSERRKNIRYSFCTDYALFDNNGEVDENALQTYLERYPDTKIEMLDDTKRELVEIWIRNWMKRWDHDYGININNQTPSLGSLQAIFKSAAEKWNQVANVNFVHVREQDGTCFTQGQATLDYLGEEVYRLLDHDILKIIPNDEVEFRIGINFLFHFAPSQFAAIPTMEEWQNRRMFLLIADLGPEEFNDLYYNGIPYYPSDEDWLPGGRIERVVTHEFGHTLSFDHITNRIENTTNGTGTGKELTPYDPNSIMQTQGGQHTYWDNFGTRVAYGHPLLDDPTALASLTATERADILEYEFCDYWKNLEQAWEVASDKNNSCDDSPQPCIKDFSAPETNPLAFDIFSRNINYFMRYHPSNSSIDYPAITTQLDLHIEALGDYVDETKPNYKNPNNFLVMEDIEGICYIKYACDEDPSTVWLENDWYPYTDPVVCSN